MIRQLASATTIFVVHACVGDRDDAHNLRGAPLATSDNSNEDVTQNDNGIEDASRSQFDGQMEEFHRWVEEMAAGSATFQRALNSIVLVDEIPATMVKLRAPEDVGRNRCDAVNEPDVPPFSDHAYVPPRFERPEVVLWERLNAMPPGDFLVGRDDRNSPSVPDPTE